MSGDLKIGRRGVKAPLHEIPLWALKGVARVFEYGGHKYAPGNWVLAADEPEPLKALEDYMSGQLRHWADIQEAGGNWLERDPESTLPHIDHAICGLIMLRGIAIKAGVLDADPGPGHTTGPPASLDPAWVVKPQ